MVFMFYKRQYKIDSETFAWLGSAWGLCAFFSQLLLVPFLSMTLGIRDTTIMIMAFASCSVSLLLEVAMSEVWALFFSWTALQLLWSNMDKAAISAISKLVGAQEIGKILCLVNLSKNDMYHISISEPAHRCSWQRHCCQWLAPRSTPPCTASLFTLAFLAFADVSPFSALSSEELLPLTQDSQ